MLFKKCLNFANILERELHWVQNSRLAVVFFQYIEDIIQLSLVFYFCFWEILFPFTHIGHSAPVIPHISWVVHQHHSSYLAGWKPGCITEISVLCVLSFLKWNTKLFPCSPINQGNLPRGRVWDLEARVSILALLILDKSQTFLPLIFLNCTSPVLFLRKVLIKTPTSYCMKN